MFLDWIKSIALPLQGKGIRTGNDHTTLSSTFGKTHCVPSCYSISNHFLLLPFDTHYMMSHCIFHFRTKNKSTQIYTHGTVARLRSNPSHILRSRREMVMKVFSKFAGSLRQGETEGTLRENGLLSYRLAFFSLVKATLLLSPREQPS